MQFTYVPDSQKSDGKVGTGSFAGGVPEDASPVPNPAEPDGYDGDGSATYPNLSVVPGATAYVPSRNAADGQPVVVDTGGSNFRITESGDTRITEAGDTLILE